MIAKLPITTKLSAEMVDMIEAQAQAQGSTRSGIIIAAIEAWLGIEPATPATPASPGTMARLDSLSAQLDSLSARVSAVEARLTAPVAAPTPTAPPTAPVAAPTAPPTAPVAAPTAPPTAPTAPVEGLDINSACMAAGLTDKPYGRNLSTMVKRRHGKTPDRALKALGWVKQGRLWYPPA
jgi:hypothetical protein